MGAKTRGRQINAAVEIRLIHEEKNELRMDGPMDGRTDGRTDRRMDGPTDGQSLLKSCVSATKNSHL